jgi:hypothetical protein
MASDSLEDFLNNITEDGTHECVLDAVSLNPSNKDGRVWLVFRHEVEDENSDINGEEITEMMQDFSHLTTDDLKDMAPKDRANARKSIRRKYDRLASLGVPEDKLSGFNDWTSLRGIRSKLTVEKTSSGFLNIKNLELI